MNFDLINSILVRNGVSDKVGWELEECCCGKQFIWRHDPKLKHGGAVLGYEKKEIKCPNCDNVIKLPKSVEAEYHW